MSIWGGTRLLQYDGNAIQKFKSDKKKKAQLWIICPICTYENKYETKKCTSLICSISSFFRID
ncbi:MAG: hypothetical protein ACW981_20980 [Candidatus Hodarchaeales archaeon]